MENASYLQGQTVSMANDLERNRSLFNLDRTGFADLMTRQARGRGLLGAFLVRRDGTAIVQADIKTERPLPAIPKDTRFLGQRAADSHSARRDQSCRRGHQAR